MRTRCFNVIPVDGNDAPCDRCGAILQVGEWPFCPHGFPAHPLTVIDDSIPNGMIIENMGPMPMTFYSKSDWRREMKARGLVNKVEHRGVPGSDKSPFTQRFV